MVYMIICGTHIMTHSSTHGVGVMAGHGVHGAAGMARSGAGITHMHGAIGAGARAGMDITTGIMADIHTEVAIS